MHEGLTALCAAIRASGIDPPDSFPDGEVFRWGHKKVYWIAFNSTPDPHAAWGCHKTGESFTWSCTANSKLAPAERDRLLREAAAQRRQRDEERNRAHRAGKELAQSQWAAAGPVSADHPYLIRKALPGLGIRQRGPLLAVPLVDAAGDIWSIQTIAADGSKRFLKGARKSGLYCPIAWPSGKLTELHICEGWATGAAIHEMTGAPVAAAMDCGNLQTAAQTIRTRWPHLPLTFCADHDGVAGGLGTACAIAAAEALGNARVLKPDCADDQHIDFADIWVRRQLQKPHHEKRIAA